MDCNFHVIDQINENIHDRTEYLQLQLNTINQKLCNCYKKMEAENNRYINITNEINNLYDLFDDQYISPCKNKCESKQKCCQKSFYFTDPNIVHKYVSDSNTIIFITMVGGGGAGGIGFIDGYYYYSGGGGGAGSSYIKKPLQVYVGTILYITVGSGAKIHRDLNTDTVIEIIHPDRQKETLIAKGGQNGCPSLKYEQCVDGGLGGISQCCPVFSGRNGFPGRISIPSQISAAAGNGASSILYEGGVGGSSYFSVGGQSGQINQIIGQDGQFGSGGGGSAPKLVIDQSQKLSGDGGNGIVIIEIS